MDLQVIKSVDIVDFHLVISTDSELTIQSKPKSLLLSDRAQALNN